MNPFSDNKGKLRDLVEALLIAVNKGLISEEEAKREFKNAIISYFNPK